MQNQAKESSCKCYAVIMDEARAKLYSGIFPDGKVPIDGNKLVTLFQGSQARYGGITVKELGHEQTANFYNMDYARVTQQQREMIAQRAAEKFQIPKDEILRDMESKQSPILARGTQLHPCDMHEVTLRDFI